MLMGTCLSGLSLRSFFYFRPIGPGRGMEKLAEEWFGKKVI